MFKTESSSKSESTPRHMASKYGILNAEYEVEKFDGTNNFSMWQCEVMDLLIQQELDIALKDQPDDWTEKEWDRINRKACGTIRLCLAKDQKYFVMRETNAKDLWKKLEDKFMSKSVENRLYLKKKLFHFQYRSGISMIEHLNDYNKVLTDLQNLEVDILDEDKALLLWNSLPDTYDHLITTLLYKKDKIRFDDVFNALVNYEHRKKDKQALQAHRDSSCEALTVGGRSESEKPGNRSSNMGCSHSKSRRASLSGKIAKDECAYCHNNGHWKKDCLTLQKHYFEKNNSQANLAYSDDEVSDQALLGSSLVCQADQWIMDSGCTNHMCMNKDWFSSMVMVDGGAIFMGNDHACETLGVGKIKLKLHDGSVHVLTNVWYVPDLKKNLISLGALDSKGYRITLEGGALKVLNGAMVVMEGTRHNNLYFLQGSTVVGGGATPSSNVGEDKLDTVRLLHMRFGHVGEEAMQGNSCMLNSSTIAKSQQFLIRTLGSFCNNQTHHQFKMRSMIRGSSLEADDLGILRSITRPLDPIRYKGQSGNLSQTSFYSSEFHHIVLAFLIVQHHL